MLLFRWSAPHDRRITAPERAQWPPGASSSPPYRSQTRTSSSHPSMPVPTALKTPHPSPLRQKRKRHPREAAAPSTIPLPPSHPSQRLHGQQPTNLQRALGLPLIWVVSISKTYPQIQAYSPSPSSLTSTSTITLCLPFPL